MPHGTGLTLTKLSSPAGHSWHVCPQPNGWAPKPPLSTRRAPPPKKKRTSTYTRKYRPASSLSLDAPPALFLRGHPLRQRKNVYHQLRRTSTPKPSDTRGGLGFLQQAALLSGQHCVLRQRAYSELPPATGRGTNSEWKHFEVASSVLFVDCLFRHYYCLLCSGQQSNMKQGVWRCLGVFVASIYLITSKAFAVHIFSQRRNPHGLSSPADNSLPSP